MIDVITGPLVVQPQVWTLVFSRVAFTRWAGWLAFGRYKHVRAYAYVPFLHVWIFYDVHLRGTDLFLAADGAPAQDVIRVWTRDADLISMRSVSRETIKTPFLGFCVPAMKSLLGIRSSALRPDTLYRHCLANGGVPFETANGCAAIPATRDAAGLCATARREQVAG